MRLIDIILTANSNMLRSKLRSTLTILAIFVGALTLTLTTGIGSGISGYINRQLGNLGATNVLIVQAKDTAATATSGLTPYDPTHKQANTSSGFARPVLTPSDIVKIAAVPGITRVTTQKTVAPDYITGANNKKYAVTVARSIGGSKLDLAAGSQLDDTAPQNQVVLPINYISDLGYSSAKAAIGGVITLSVTDPLGGQSIQTGTVVGVEQAGILNSGGIVLNTTFEEALYNAQSVGLPKSLKDQYIYALAYFSPTASAQDITNYKNSLVSLGFTAQTVKDTIGIFEQVINGIILVLDAFGIIALLAASFGIINTLLMSVQERTKEIGLMKAMGMNAKRIFMLFSLEAVLLGFWGSLFGVVAAEIIGNIVNRIAAKSFLSSLPGLQLLSFPILNTLKIVLLIMGIAFLAGTLPAWRASRQNPIDALRYE